MTTQTMLDSASTDFTTHVLASSTEYE